MTMSELPGNGTTPEDQGPRDKSNGYNLEWIERFIGRGTEVMFEIHQVHQDSQVIIDDNGLLKHLGLIDLENPIQKQAAEMFKFFLMEGFLRNRLKAVSVGEGSEDQVAVATVALEFVAGVNREELDLLPNKARPIKYAVDDLLRSIENETGESLNLKTTLNPASLARWAEKHKLIAK